MKRAQQKCPTPSFWFGFNVDEVHFARFRKPYSQSYFRHTARHGLGRRFQAIVLESPKAQRLEALAVIIGSAVDGLVLIFHFKDRSCWTYTTSDLLDVPS